MIEIDVYDNEMLAFTTEVDVLPTEGETVELEGCLVLVLKVLVVDELHQVHIEYL